MKLAQWRGDWYLLVNINELNQTARLRCGKRMPCQLQTDSQWINTGVVAIDHELVVYSAAYWRGFLVRPFDWVDESLEPTLICSIRMSELFERIGYQDLWNELDRRGFKTFDQASPDLRKEYEAAKQAERAIEEHLEKSGWKRYYGDYGGEFFKHCPLRELEVVHESREETA